MTKPIAARILLFSPAALAMAMPVAAAERGYSVTDFDRVRVDGPYKVTLATGRSPSGRAFGSAAAIDGVSVEMQGRTVIVRRNSQTWGSGAAAGGGPVEVRLTGYAVRAASLNGAGSLAIDKLKGQSIDLSVAGSGALSVGAIEADRLNVAIVGSGRAKLTGKAATATLGVRGTGSIEAGALTVKDVKIAADGPGDIAVTATSSAGVVSNGAGNVAVGGDPACTVKSTGSGTVACGG